MHVYMPWWLDNSKLDFPRGYHIEVWGGLSALLACDVPIVANVVDPHCHSIPAVAEKM